MDDIELHERLIMLDPGALSEWEAAHRPAVVGWLVRGGLAPSDAEEVWNDVFAATINAAPRLEPRGPSLRRYAFKVARNLRADRLAAASRIPTTHLDPEYNPVAPAPSRLAVDERRVAALRGCLDRCPERYRVVVELAESGHDVDELARLLGVEPESVYQIRHRARLWLQRCIGEAVR
jgi:RNA polymerase sigma factor (sigma-70 family)